MDQQNAHKIVILESNQDRRDYLRSMISEWGYKPFLFGMESICLDNISPLNPDLVISGFLTAERAYRFINTVKAKNSALPMVIISDDAEISDFIDTNGFDGISVIKSELRPAEIKVVVGRVLTNGRRCPGNPNCPLIIGTSAEIVKIKRMIPELNRLSDPILVQGEAGTGKELVARVIHEKSDRWDKPFVKFSIAEISDDSDEWFEENFYEHPGTSPMGDVQSLRDILYGANTGTLFFERIDSMPSRLQAKLLGFLEESGLLVTSSKRLDIRIIASTRLGMDGLIARGKFRKDLYFRMNVITISIPPLRHRRKDISGLADYFADKYCIELGRGHIELSDEIKYLFGAYDWPENVRELENLVKSIVTEGNEAEIVEKLNLVNGSWNEADGTLDEIYFAEIEKIKQYLQKKKNYSLKDASRLYLSRVEKRLMEKALEVSKWNRSKAAAMLGISYKSLLNKIKEYHLN